MKTIGKWRNSNAFKEKSNEIKLNREVGKINVIILGLSSV